MSTLSELLAEHTALDGDVVDHLQRLVAEWQLLADLSFADFLLWVRVDDEVGGHGAPLICVAQARPTTSPTVHSEDVVGSVLRDRDHTELVRAMEQVRVLAAEQPVWFQGTPLRRTVIPVTVDGVVVAALSRDTGVVRARVRSALETAYTGCAEDLLQMVVDGSFPAADELADIHTSPRAGDGFVHLDEAGTVLYASPNAISAYHRMGLPTDIVGADLAGVTRDLVSDSFDGSEVVARLSAALQGRSSPRIEVDARGATVLVRALPLRPQERPAGALVLIRDVTEVKRRDRALLSKDATIREIHHRVKNNLQTVAALLRLQARRTTNDEARSALAESVRRVSSIALVHDTLAMSVDERVDLDDVVDRLLPMMTDVTTINSAVRVRRDGKLGVLAAELATPLVMVLTELVQNALEHGFAPSQPGAVVISAARSAKHLDVVVHDDGVGLPDGFSLAGSDRLGLQIVRTLVDAELRGSIDLQPAPSGGTDAVLRVPLGRRSR